MKYRKKPVVIEAYQTDKELGIETLEGTMHASVGDYIITGVRGEKYPCKPDIFEQTYEPADVPTASPWHRVEEGMPDDSREVIIFTVSGIIGVGSFIRPNWYQWYSGGGLPVDVTHWMPLPEPPKEDAYGDT